MYKIKYYVQNKYNICKIKDTELVPVKHKLQNTKQIK